MSLIEDWIADLRRALGAEALTLHDVRVGLFNTAVRIDTGHVGLAFTPRGPGGGVCCPRPGAWQPPPGRLAGADAWRLAGDAAGADPLRRAIGIAALNALSALAIERYGVPGGRAVESMDALAAAAVRDAERVVMVGAFPPFIEALAGRVASLEVIDEHREALPRGKHHLWVPAERAAAALARADVALLTGSSLVAGGLDALLDACARARVVVLAGPSASAWPPPFFARGVDVLAGLRIVDPERILRVVSEGGSVRFFGDAARKWCLVRDAVDQAAAQG